VNLKLLIPTYRTRQNWANDVLRDLGVRGRMLNVGTGEGDVDPILARYATVLESCDVNPDDIAHAREMNANVPNLRYSVQNGEALGFESASFDVVTCFEVIEHVGDARKLMSELARVLKPGGALVLSCPSVHFPIAYDPINAALAGRGTHLPIGAYAYGHSWLVDAKELEGWASENRLEIEKRFKLSGWLVGAAECYWPGLVQRMLKANTSNTAGKSGRGVRPSGDAPPLVGVVDALIAVDRAVSSFSSRSVGLGYVMRKPG
jgi:2-polyprenyl-3-methyl-5-hydroxy-6-metoxy-1,4-benzoquinol methylase